MFHWYQWGFTESRRVKSEVMMNWPNPGDIITTAEQNTKIPIFRALWKSGITFTSSGYKCLYCCWAQVLRTIRLKKWSQKWLLVLTNPQFHNEFLVLLTSLGHESIFQVMLLVLQPFSADTPTVCSLNGRQLSWQRVDHSSSLCDIFLSCWSEHKQIFGEPQLHTDANVAPWLLYE